MPKDNKMKSTVKIDYSSRSDGHIACIKIIQPQLALDFLTDPEFDVRDKLIRDFLHRPGNVFDNTWFKVGTTYPNDFNNPTAQITTIEPLKEEELFYQFRHAILNRLVPYDDICQLNMAGSENKYDRTVPKLSEERYVQIHAFFDWLGNEEWASWDEQNPHLPENRAIKENTPRSGD